MAGAFERLGAGVPGPVAQWLERGDSWRRSSRPCSRSSWTDTRNHTLTSVALVLTIAIPAAPILVLGENHFSRTSGSAAVPTLLAIPRRGLYTDVTVPGAVGTERRPPRSWITSIACRGSKGDTSSLLPSRFAATVLSLRDGVAVRWRRSHREGDPQTAHPTITPSIPRARLGPVKALRFAPTPRGGGGGLGRALGRATDRCHVMVGEL